MVCAAVEAGPVACRAQRGPRRSEQDGRDSDGGSAADDGCDATARVGGAPLRAGHCTAQAVPGGVALQRTERLGPERASAEGWAGRRRDHRGGASRRRDRPEARRRAGATCAAWWLGRFFAGDFGAPNTTACPTGIPPGIPSPSTWDTNPGSRPGQIPGSILLKKKGESIAIALPTSFGGTDKPRVVVVDVPGGEMAWVASCARSESPDTKRHFCRGDAKGDTSA